MRILVSLIALPLLVGHGLFAQAQERTFAFEPVNKASIVSQSELKKRDVITVTAYRLRDNETLHLFRCGDPCNTAKHILSWTASMFEDGPVQRVEIRQKGVYYFWIQRKLTNGEVGPVFGDNSEIRGETRLFHFVSGSTISIVVSSSIGKKIRQSGRGA
jgi:hypothetical protein